jgi:hypothetical protein
MGNETSVASGRISLRGIEEERELLEMKEYLTM